jgi:hypothetical protein
MFLMKTDVDGNFLWMEVYGDGLQDEGFHCEVDDDGGFLVPGFTLSYIFTDSTQMMVIKTDGNGISGCHEKSAVPVSGVYPITEINDTFLVQSVPSFDTLLITQNNANITSNDACLFAGEEQITSNDFNIFPVPVKDHLNINVEDNSVVRIYSPNGIMLKEINLHGDSKIDVSDLPCGYYIVSEISSHQAKKGKFIIAR